MDYALIEEGVVTNLIWLYPGNEDDFPGAVPLGGCPAAIGDTFEGGAFYRDGERVVSAAQAMEEDIRLLLETAGDQEYRLCLMELGVNDSDL